MEPQPFFVGILLTLKPDAIRSEREVVIAKAMLLEELDDILFKGIPGDRPSRLDGISGLGLTLGFDMPFFLLERVGNLKSGRKSES